MNNFQVGTSPMTGNPLQFTHILLQELEEGVATLNHNDQITYCNAAFEQLVHKPAQAIHGFLLTDLFPDAGLPEILPASGYRQQLAGYLGGQLSLKVIPILVEEDRDAGGKLVILKKAANSNGSPLSPQLSEKIVGAAPALVAVYEPASGRCVYVNQTAAHTLGYQPAEWTAGGPDFAGSLLHPDDAASVIAGVGTILMKLHEGETAQAGSKPDLPVFRIRLKNGDWKWLQVAGIIPERDTAGRLQQVAVVLADITDSKNAGEKMIRNEAMLAQAQAAAGFGLWEYYVADSRMEWSDEMYRIYGYQPGEVEVSLQLYARVLHPDDCARFRQEVDQIIRDHRPYTAQRRIFRPDGTMRYLISRTDLVKDEAGALLKVIGFTVDVTDLQHARQELSDKGHFIGRITDTIPYILYIYDIKQQQNVYSNRRLPEVLGFPVEEVQQMGDRFLSLFTHTDDFPKVREGREKLALASDTDVVEVEYRIMDPQGNWHWFFDRATVFSRDPDGSVRQVLGSSQDVTERRLAQEQLAESEYFIKQVADASPDGLYVYDLQQERLVYSNRQIYQKLGYTEDEFNAMGVKTTEMITHPEDLPRRREHFERLRRMPDREVAEIDYRVQTITGTWLWVRSRDSVFKRTSTGEPWQVLGIVQDITDRKRGAEELRYKNHLIGLILSGFPLILSRVSKEGILLEATGSGLRSMGLAENQLVGINMLSQYPDIAPYIREVMKGNKATFLSEMEVDGEKKYFQNYYFYDQEQNCAVGFSVDVTEQKEAEEKLAESRQFIEQITSAIPQIIYVFDLIEGRNIYINREVNTSLGYSPEQVIGMESNVLVNLQPPEEREMVRKHFERVIAMPDQVHELEYRMKDAAGNWRWFYSRDILFKATPEGQPWQILGSTQDITARKAIEMRVQESEQLLRESQEIAHVGSYSWDLGQDVIRWTDEHYRMFGLEPKDHMTLPEVQPLFHPDDAQRVIHGLQQSIATGELFNCSFRIIRPDGQERHLWSKARVIFDEQAKPLRLAGSVLDVTELKRAEAELRESKHFIQQIADATLDVLFLYDLQTRKVVYVNREIFSMLGYSPEEIYQINQEQAVAFIHPDDRGKRARHYEALAEANDNQIYELEYRVKDAPGNWRWIYMRNTVFKRDQEGRVAQVIGLSQDITARKKAEHDLAESQRFIGRIADTSPDHLYVFDLAQNQLIYINREIYNSLGYTPEELYAYRGNVIASLMHPGDIPVVTEHLAGFAGAKDSELREVEYRLKDARGNWRWIQARETVFRRDNNGVPVQITGVSRDVTDRKKAEEEIRFKNKIIEGILSNLPVILCRIDEDGVIRESVGAGLHQLGRQDGEIVGENVFTNTRYAGISSYIRQVLQGGSTTFVGQPVHQGKSFYFLNYYYFDPEQRMAVGFSLDISQQKETEEKLKRSEEQLRELNTGLERRVQERTAELTASEERYRAFVQQSSEAIWRFEFDGIQELDTSLPEDEQIDLIYRHAYLAECNDTMAQMYGYDHAREIIGTRFADLTPPNEPANTEYLRSFIRARYRLANAESVEVDRAGNLKYFLNNLTGITREGNLIRAWGTQRDITDRKRAEEALREKEQEYRSLVTATSQMIWYASPEGLITEDIPLWRRYTGQSREEVLGYGWTEALHPHDRERSEYTWKRSVERSQVYETEYRVRSKRGEYRWFFARSVPIFDRNGNIKRWIGACNDIHDRKLAEEALRISEERLELAVRAAGIGIFDWHIPEGTVILTEQEERIFGMAHGSFKGTLQGWMDFVLPEDYPELWRQLQSGIDRRNPGLYAQYRIKRTDGEIRWLEAVGKFIYNKAGTPMRAVGINVDITGRKLAEQALRESESRFRRLFESDMVGILFSNPTGVVTDANNAFLHLLGYTREDLNAGQIRLKDITPAEYTTLDEAAAQELIAKGLIAPYEKEYIRKDGSRVAVLIGATLLKEVNPGVAVGFVLDISDRKKAQERLHLSEERFRLVAEATNEGIWDWEIGVDKVWRNEGYYKLFGYENSGIASDFENWKMRLHPEDAGRVKRGVEEALHSDRENWSDEYRIRRSDGTYAYIMDRAYILRDKQGRPLRMIGSKIDLTQLKETQSALEQQAIELKQSNADLEQFAYISSHDLQEPLNTAASFAKLLKRRYENQLDGDANDFINFITDATNRMKRIIRSLLEYSRITSESREMIVVPVDRVLEEVQQNLKQRIAESGAVIRIGAMPGVRANETQMLQLFQNLIGNAVKFRSSQPPVITIQAEEQPGHWLFSVADNGIGMDMKHAEKKIFQVFQRLHGRDEYEGTGIGLAISKKIVERHGGTIWADSQPGKGTIFYFTLKK